MEQFPQILLRVFPLFYMNPWIIIAPHYSQKQSQAQDHHREESMVGTNE